ncbi:MAG: hypothetical protein ABI658_10040 [Acidimicrobiales bacterium]
MSYMVLYTGLDGSSAFGRCEELNDAVAEVERLRNDQSIDGAQIYRLEEVKFEIKPYFRVELPVTAIATEPAPPIVAAPPLTEAPSVEGTPWTATPAAAATEVPSMVAPPPPPPPPPPAPVAPMAYDVAPIAYESEPHDEDAIVGSRRGLFGR